MNRYRLVHTTEFVYDGPVSESYNEVRLRPMHDERQSCLSFRLTTTPGSHGTAYRDAYGNWVHQFNVLSEHRRLKVEAESVVLAHDAAGASVYPRSAKHAEGRIRQPSPNSIRAATRWMRSTSISWPPPDYVPHLAALSEIIEDCRDESAAEPWRDLRRLLRI